MADRDDLLRMLDLAGTEHDPPHDPALSFTPADAGAGFGGRDGDVPEPSPTALELDDWGLRRGREVLAESERLRATGLGEAEAADFHGAAFEPEPVLAPACTDPRRREFLARLLETPDYQALHGSTMLDPVASSIAACAFAEQFAALRREDTARPPAGSGAKAGLAEEMSALRAAGRAVKEAEREVESCRDACSALGMGPGAPGSNDPRVIAALFRRVRNNPTLRRICDLAGRYRLLAQSRQRQKAAHGLDDVVGVTLAGDPGRALPQELARLAGEEGDPLADEALLRLAEGRLMCREYRATEPAARGPVIVCVDESSSMCGEKGHAAKALALALAWVARAQNRWCALVAYSGDTGERLLALPPGRRDEVALMDWLEPFLGRGSSIDVPVREMPRIYRELGAPHGKTDVVFVTDAQARLPADVRDAFLSWKASARARLITLVIRGRPGDLAAVSDEVHCVASLEVGEAAVGRVLSV